MHVQIPSSGDGGSAEPPEPPSREDSLLDGILMIEPKHRQESVSQQEASTSHSYVQSSETRESTNDMESSSSNVAVNVDLHSSSATGNKRRKLRHVVDDCEIENSAAVKAEQDRIDRLNKLKARQAEEDKRIAEIRSLETPSPPRDDEDEQPAIEDVQFLEMRQTFGEPSTSHQQPQQQLEPCQLYSSLNDNDLALNAQQQYWNYAKHDPSTYRRIEPAIHHFKQQVPQSNRRVDIRPPTISYAGTATPTKEQTEELDMWHLVQRAMHSTESSQKNCKQRKQAELEDQGLAPCGRLRVSEIDKDVYFPFHLSQHLKPHQIAGVRFMYDNVIESVKVYPESSGFGCVLAHNMGLGKTLQIITFCNIFFDIYRFIRGHRLLIVVPVNTLQNWANEFEKWSPEKRSADNTRLRDWKVYTMGDDIKTRSARIDILKEWFVHGGVFLIGYEMIRLLQTNPQDQKDKVVNNVNMSAEEKIEECKKIDEGYTVVMQCLFNPGPDAVICDEGHRIKNLKSETSNVLKSIKTKRRIILTGYPLQNNLGEYFCMVDFVRPGFLGTKKQFSSMFERPIQNGQCIDSTPSDVSLAKRRTHVLTKLLRPFVQRRGPKLLRMSLPPCREYVIYVRKSGVQRYLYRQFFLQAAEEMKSTGNSKYNPLSAFAICMRIWNHPDLLQKLIQREKKKEAKKKNANLVTSSSCPQLKSEETDCWNNSNAANECPGPLLQLNNEAGNPNAWVANGFNSMLYDTTNNFITNPAQFVNNPFGNGGLQMIPIHPGTAFSNSNLLKKEEPEFGWNHQPPLKEPTLSSKQYDSFDSGAFQPVQAENSNVVKTKKEEGLRGIPEAASSRKNGATDFFKPVMKFDDDAIENLLLKNQMFEWADGALGDDYVEGVVENSYKMHLSMEIIDATTANNEKILLFSQSVKTLNLIEAFLKNRPLHLPNSEQGVWKKNVTFMRFDGSTKGNERQELIKRFNAEDTLKLFLISTKAGSLGINLVSANRVILYDVNWNPCHDAQAVCRVLRFGQTKETFVYRMVTDNSMERTIFKRQISKQGLQCKIVDEQSIQANVSTSELEKLMHFDEQLDLKTAPHDTTDWKLDDRLLHGIVCKLNHMLTGVPELYESYISAQDENISVEEGIEAEAWFAQQVRHLNKPALPNGGGTYAERYGSNVAPVANVYPQVYRQGNVPRLAMPANSDVFNNNNVWSAFQAPNQLNGVYHNIAPVNIPPAQNVNCEPVSITCTAVPEDFIPKLLTYKPYCFYAERPYMFEYKDAGTRIEIPINTAIGYVKCRKGSFAIIEGFGNVLYVNVTSATFKEVPKDVRTDGNREVITLE